jgi:hypothetical protein
VAFLVASTRREDGTAVVVVAPSASPVPPEEARREPPGRDGDAVPPGHNWPSLPSTPAPNPRRAEAVPEASSAPPTERSAPEERKTDTPFDGSTIPIDRSVLKSLGALTGPFGDAYRSATRGRTHQECLGGKLREGPRQRVTLILSLEEHLDGVLIVEASLDPDATEPLPDDVQALVTCIQRVHRNLFLQVEGTTAGRRHRVPWPIVF